MAERESCRCCQVHFDCCKCWAKEDNLCFSKSLHQIPKFVPATWADWLMSSGKGNTGCKCWKFFKEAYVHNIYIGLQGSDASEGLIRARCHRSMKKNEEPHSMLVCVLEDNKRAKVLRAHCSCKAGSGGHCNHVFALLLQLNDFSCSGLSEIPVSLTCTSKPQQWHIPRSNSISPSPVMGTHYAKAIKDIQEDTRKKRPVQCKLYKATNGNMVLSSESIVTQVNDLSNMPNPPPFSYLLSDQEPSMQINTILGNVPLGSCLSYQLFDFGKSGTRFECNLEIPTEVDSSPCLKYPDIPLSSEGQLSCMTQFKNKAAEIWFKENVELNIEESILLEKRTILQGESKEWLLQRKVRLTASNFGKVLFRVKEPTEAMLERIFKPDDLGRVRAIAHGKGKENLARTIYARKMQKRIQSFAVFDAGLVTNPSYPHLGASPDGKVFNPAMHPPYGLLEIKCPFTQRHLSLDAAVTDPSFYLQKENKSFTLKKEHRCGYFAQVQGQMALSGLQWCDFCVFLSERNEMCVIQVNFDEQYWKQELLPKLSEFYFKYGIEYLM